MGSPPVVPLDIGFIQQERKEDAEGAEGIEGIEDIEGMEGIEDLEGIEGLEAIDAYGVEVIEVYVDTIGIKDDNCPVTIPKHKRIYNILIKTTIFINCSLYIRKSSIF